MGGHRENLAGYVFEEDGPTYAGTDTAALAWRFGPPGKPIARGIDILTIRDGRVSTVRTMIAPEPARDQPLPLAIETANRTVRFAEQPGAVVRLLLLRWSQEGGP